MRDDLTSNGADAFVSARDFLLRHREDYETTFRDFEWPKLDRFNWALDYFDVMARDNAQPALWLVDDDGGEIKLSFAVLSERSNQIANALRDLGDEARRRDRSGHDAAHARRSQRSLCARPDPPRRYEHPRGGEICRLARRLYAHRRRRRCSRLDFV
jgi:hypothetical protein